MKTEKFDVTGMTCASCVANIEKSVRKLGGVGVVNVNLLTNSMTVKYDERVLTKDEIEHSVENAGYEAHVQQSFSNSKLPVVEIDFIQSEQQEMKLRWWVSLVFLIPLLYISMGHMLGLALPFFFQGAQNALVFAFTQFLLTLPIVFVNKKYFIIGFKTLFKGKPNMDSLIAIGSSAAIFYGIFAIYRIAFALGQSDFETVHSFSHDLYFESGATILTLITLGKYLESRSKSRTTEAIKKLIDLVPKTATVLRGAVEVEIGVEELVVGDVIVIKPGQRIPVDGVVETGSSSLDESALTGESMPVFKKSGDLILSASINKLGYFTFRATKVGRDTTLSQIIQLVEDASSSKAPISKLADKISGVFVPIVIAIAVISTVVWLLVGYPFDFALSIGIAVLVISCPCALGLATPVAIMVGTGKGAEYGILIKSAESLEMAHKINTVVLDKTGTITEGKPKVTDVFCLDSITKRQLLELAASLEKLSEHPLSDAILTEANRLELQVFDVRDFQIVPGQGIEGLIGNKKYVAGNIGLMLDRDIDIKHFKALSDKLAVDGKTPLFIADEKKVLGLIAVADVLKPTSKIAIDQFKEMGMQVIMLTGDHSGTAAAIQLKIGVDNVISEVLPQGKEKEIAKLQDSGRIVAMIGDGINDAPALMRSHLGIAIGAGTDIAVESADVVLMRSDLLDAVTTLRLSKAVMKNIKQNLFWAFFYNIIGIPLAAGVFYFVMGWKLNPMFAAAAMSLSSVTVVLNALRLLKFKPLVDRSISKENWDEELVLDNTPKKDARQFKLLRQEKPNVILSSVIGKEGVFENEVTTILANGIEKETHQNKEIMIEKTLQIKGMSCGHCSARVEKVLNSIDGVEAKVNLETNSAKLILSADVTDAVLKNAVDNIGYEVVSVEVN